MRLESYNLTPWPPLPAKHDAMQNAAHVKEGGEDLEKDLIRELKPRFDSDPGTTTVQERLIELRKFLSEQRLLS